MAGKRLLDAAKLLDAGTSVAKQHFTIRRQQWEVYLKTSALAQAVKSQTDRVTVTANAAYELAKRLDEDSPSWRWQQEQAHQAYQNVKETAKAYASNSDAGTETASRTSETYPSKSVKEERDDGTLSALRRRELQRAAESQIPEASAVSPPTADLPGQDIFNERSETVSRELSSLPRTKLPKHVESNQDTDKSLADKELNADVYYAPKDRGDHDMVSPDGVNTSIGSSPRISDMLRQTTSGAAKKGYGDKKRLPPQPLPEMVAARKRWDEESEKASQDKEATVSTHPPSQPTSNGLDSETQKLAKAIAQEKDSLVQEPEQQPITTPNEMRESRVPSSRFGRLWQYSGLAASMTFGAMGEGFRRMTGGSTEGSLVLSEANMNRLVAKLSRMRGAALKMGQMISFQDSKVLPATINTVLQRVQDSADYMPSSQRDQVLAGNLGPNWRDLFSEFQEKPFAAASIGQVHKAVLASDSKEVAIKVQYPGVRNSIDSDLNNLALLLTASRLLPKGLYLEKTIANARTELGWECDYEREADACTRFGALVQDEPDTFAVPTVFKEASGRDVLTAEFMAGTAVTKITNLTQDERDWIGTQILRLCLRELMEWRFMQTDPNWTNFLYNRHTRKLELLDFGASREFPDRFVEPYVHLLIAASKGDRDSCRDLSIELGYLTGHESNEMLNAHIDSILTLAEPFVESAPEVYDFEDQTITGRVRANIGLMLRERLAPPPEETYSLHRKLSGAFLLCARLKSKIKARDMFANAVQVWNGRANKVEKPSP